MVAIFIFLYWNRKCNRKLIFGGKCENTLSQSRKTQSLLAVWYTELRKVGYFGIMRIRRSRTKTATASCTHEANQRFNPLGPKENQNILGEIL